ncbi:MAG: outer membrane beta-barrel protein [Bacteroidales bacterium]|nr:outer membrane beta-barrel protein [Bacteroidales bacterium]
MKKLILINLIALSSIGLNAQNYNGNIVDSNNEPIPYANVVLQSLPDSSFVCGTISDENGNFNVNCDKQADILKISYIGYKTIFLNPNTDNLNNIILPEENTELSEVVIKAQMPKTKLQGSSMITSIEGTVLEKSGTCQEVLSKVPGIIKGKDGLEVIGKGSPTYYVNGRQIHDNDELKYILSDEIVSIEVILNPGAEYPANISSVVKIKTKRRQGDGFGFDTEIHQDQEINHGLSNPGGCFNLNYRHNNFDIFGGVDAWTWDSYQYSSPNQTTYTNKIYNQESNCINAWNGYGFKYKFGTNYQVNQNHSFGFRGEYNDQKKDISDFIFNTQLKVNDIIENQLSTNSTTPTDYLYSYNANAYYNGTVGKLNIDLNGSIYQSKTEDKTEGTEVSSNDNEDVNSSTDIKNSIYATKLVLSYPIWKGQFKFGSELTKVDRLNEYITSVSSISNSKSDVNENTTAIFAEYGFGLNQYLQGSLGLRYEYTKYNFDDQLFSDDTKYNDNNVFPSFALSSQIGKIQLSLSYSAKTQRPSYWALNDAVTYINHYSYQSGNSKLKNTISQDLSLNLHYNVFNLYASYNVQKNATTQWSFLYDNVMNTTDHEGVILLKNINFDKNINSGIIYLSANPTFGCYTPNWSAGIQKQWFKLDVEDYRETKGYRNVEFNKPIFIANLNNALRFKGSWQIEANYSLISKGNTQNFYLSEGMNSLDLVVQKSFLNDNLTIRLSWADVTGNKVQIIDLDCGYYQLTQRTEDFCSRIKLSIRYKFNTAQSKYKGTGAGDDAMNRMNK